MNGAREFADLFETGQYGKLYIVSGVHARGRIFKIFILPAGQKAISNGNNNSPLNDDAVEVYGILGGHPGWTEYYGWIHKGPWVNDFNLLVSNQEQEILLQTIAIEKKKLQNTQQERKRIFELLNNY